MAVASLVERAAQIAYQGHIAQKRKDDGSPYFIHPCMVAMLLRRHGFADEVVAAAFVHDVLEDTSVTAEELTAKLGKEVVDIVLSVSEDKGLPWEERKAAYVEQVARSSDATKAVSVADKIHNLESLLAAYAEKGPSVWKVFNRGKAQKYWFESTLLKRLQETWNHPLLDEYAALVERMSVLEAEPT